MGYILFSRSSISIPFQRITSKRITKRILQEVYKKVSLWGIPLLSFYIPIEYSGNINIQGSAPLYKPLVQVLRILIELCVNFSRTMEAMVSRLRTSVNSFDLAKKTVNCTGCVSDGFEGCSDIEMSIKI